MFKRILSSILIVCFSASLITAPSPVRAQGVLGLPAPGTMVNLSVPYEPAMIKGLTVHKDNPFLFDFIVDPGQDNKDFVIPAKAGIQQQEQLKKEGEKLIKYFLASLAVPEKDIWVNLSPYEKDRMVPEALGQTDMGRDLLAQDYLLKQITASLIYPEKGLGKKFWDKVYERIRIEHPDTPSGGRDPDFHNNIPVNVGTFNKVWILADQAEVFERNGSAGSPQANTAFVTKSHLRVMLEEDYLALKKGLSPPSRTTFGTIGGPEHKASSVIREIILPELEKEVNTGKNFANLRQIVNSLILANWYKKNLKTALLNQVDAGRSKIKGIVMVPSPLWRGQGRGDVEEIYQKYLQAYKKGVFNYI